MAEGILGLVPKELLDAFAIEQCETSADYDIDVDTLLRRARRAAA